MSFTIINFVHLGIRKDMPFDVSKRIQIVNISASLAVLTAVFYLIKFSPSFIALCSLCFLLLFALTWAFNKNGRYTTAKVCLYIFSIMYLFLLASTLGEGSAVHFMLIPVVVSMCLSFQGKERKWLVLSITSALVVYIVLEFTNFSLFTSALFADSRWLWQASLTITICGTLLMVGYYIYKDDVYLEKSEQLIQYGQDIDHTVAFFTQSLTDKETVEEVFWDVTRNCIGKLGFVDCVVYLMDRKNQKLRQVAAFGQKNAEGFEIYNPIDIPFTKGIVGAAASEKKSILVKDTSQDSRYIIDDQQRLSEIAVPLIYKNKVIGVIDSEHPQKNFFNYHHVKLLQTIARLCVDKVGPMLTLSTLEPADLDAASHLNKAEELFLEQLKTTVFIHIDKADLSGEILAKELGMSRMQLHRKVTRIVGCSPGEFVRQLRLNKAAELLSQGEAVSQSAYATGFSSLSYFSKAFKTQFGVLPSSYHPAGGKENTLLQQSQ